MAFNTSDPRVEYTATGGQINFPFTFAVFEDTDFKVYLTPVGQTPDDTADLLAITTDYTVNLNVDPETGGSIDLVVPATNGDMVTLVRDLPIDRDTDYQENGNLFAATLNSDQNYQTYLNQQNASNQNRFVVLPDSVQGVSVTLPAPVSDSYIKWNAAANALENDTSIPTNVVTATDAALDAGSWANENEDVPVKEYDNGVPSDRPGPVYSAKHWAIKAEDAVIGDVEFRDTEFRIFDDADETKKLKFEISGIDTGTTGTITMPNYNVVAGGIKDKEVDDAAIGDDKIIVYKLGTDKFEYEEKPTTSDRVLATTEVQTEGQNWNGIVYVDPDAVGANPTAKIYPDGTVVGSTDNGEYTKYPNGDLICRYKQTTGVGATIAYGTLFRSTGSTFTFPVAFVATPRVSDASNAEQRYGNGHIFQTPSNTQVTMVFMTPSSGATDAGRLGYIAKGRWK